MATILQFAHPMSRPKVNDAILVDLCAHLERAGYKVRLLSGFLRKNGGSVQRVAVRPEISEDDEVWMRLKYDVFSVTRECLVAWWENEHGPN